MDPYIPEEVKIKKVFLKNATESICLGRFYKISAKRRNQLGKFRKNKCYHHRQYGLIKK
jgi:hypothetical protein